MLKKLITFLLVISANSFNIGYKSNYPAFNAIVLNLDSKFSLFNEINDNMSTAMVKLLSNTYDNLIQSVILY